MSFLKALKGALSSVLFGVITLLVFVPLFPLALLKVIIPFAPWRVFCSRGLNAVAYCWMAANAKHQTVLLPTQITLSGVSDLRRDEWYMMVANHQSWVDVLVLLRVFHHRIPALKFFIKQSLIWVPFLGLAWWALDFPFMRRYSKTLLEKNPHLQGRDIEETRMACKKFRHHPVTIINFLEGTRFTQAKHRQQSSVYSQLLMPKAGGLAFALSAMNGQLHQLLDVTLYYPQGRPSYWDYVSGAVRAIEVHVVTRDIPAQMLGDYAGDAQFKADFQRWVNGFWLEKEQLLQALVERDKNLRKL